MKIDPKLLRRLEERDDANEVLAEALGCCPTCGQQLPGEERPKDKRAAILAWRSENPGKTQSACSKALGVSQAYVGRVWHDADSRSALDVLIDEQREPGNAMVDTKE